MLPAQDVPCLRFPNSGSTVATNSAIRRNPQARSASTDFQLISTTKRNILQEFFLKNMHPAYSAKGSSSKPLTSFLLLLWFLLSFVFWSFLKRSLLVPNLLRKKAWSVLQPSTIWRHAVEVAISTSSPLLSNCPGASTTTRSSSPGLTTTAPRLRLRQKDRKLIPKRLKQLKSSLLAAKSNTPLLLRWVTFQTSHRGQFWSLPTDF